MSCEQPIRIDWLDPTNSRQVNQLLILVERAGALSMRRKTECSHSKPFRLIRVAVIGKTVVGGLIYDIWRSIWRIASVAIAPGWQRRGVGSRLLNCLKSQTRKHDRPCDILAEIPKSDSHARLFFQANQFRWTETITDPVDEVVCVMKWSKLSLLVSVGGCP